MCALFLLHLRSAFVAVVSLPLGVLAAFIVMRYQGVNANIMSLGGIAIAIGAMVDAAIVMIENAHKKLEAWTHEHPGDDAADDERWRVITDAAVEVGPGAVLQPARHHAVVRAGVHARSAGRPAVLAARLHQDLRDGRGGRASSVTLVPVLMGYFIRGRIPDGARNPLNRFADRGVPAGAATSRCAGRRRRSSSRRSRCRDAPRGRCSRLGGEFMPPLDEGDLLYMPTALPGHLGGQGGASSCSRPIA